MKMILYAAHPITGMTYINVMEYFNGLICDVGNIYRILHPMLGKSHLSNERQFAPSGYTHPVSTDRAIIGRDRWMVSQCDVLLVDFTGANTISIGCVMELAWAHDKGKHVVVVLPDGNCHSHAFVKQAADIIFDRYRDAIRYLCELTELLKTEAAQ